jgi:hypothetical protein
VRPKKNILYMYLVFGLLLSVSGHTEELSGKARARGAVDTETIQLGCCHGQIGNFYVDFYCNSYCTNNMPF